LQDQISEIQAQRKTTNEKCKQTKRGTNPKLNRGRKKTHWKNRAVSLFSRCSFFQMSDHHSMNKVQAITSSQQLPNTVLVLTNLNICKTTGFSHSTISSLQLNIKKADH